MDGSINPAAIFKDRFTNINTAKGQIEKQREREQHQERLRLEFDQIDINNDGKVTYEELYTFLQDKVRVSTTTESLSPQDSLFSSFIHSSFSRDYNHL